jgi:hypothetical protein
MRNIFVFILPLMLMSGCLSSASPETIVIDEPIYVDESWDNKSHQFWNINPMSVGNTSVMTFNNSGDLIFYLELTAFFHEPLLWEQGFVNYSLIYNNETVWSIEENLSITESTFNMTNVSGNITIQVRASGSDSQIDDNPGDFYIATARFELIY